MLSNRQALTRVASVITAILTAAALGGCAQGTGGRTDADVDYDSTASLSGSLQIMGFGLSDEVAETRADLAKNELGADVKLDLVEGDLDTQQFLSAIAAGDPPDAVYVNRDQVGSLAARGAIVDLGSCIAGESIDTGQYKPSALAQVTFDGAVYGIPEFNQVELTMANQGLLDAAGLGTADVDGSSWEKLAAATTALAKSSGGAVSVIGYDSKLPDFLPLWAKANGADLLSADGRTAQLDDPKVVEALDFAAGLYRDQGGFSAIKSFRDAADFFGAENQYASNTLGAMPMEQWYLNVLNDVSPDASLAFTTFKTRQGEPIAFTGGSAWAIPSGSKNAAAACRWAKAMTSVDAWQAAADARKSVRDADGKPFTGLLTGNDVADERIQAMASSGDDVWSQGVTAMYQANDAAFTLPANPADNEFKQAYLDAANRVLNGQASAQDSLDQAQDEAQTALDTAWEKIGSQP
ncbi:extracellular solute-binding protein [Microbacteriaceae bacterium VKM Ac-2855]|nr:extracellular solute-binding protein [Microbacteriaceae bacterium VKM Ac-2855]